MNQSRRNLIMGGATIVGAGLLAGKQGLATAILPQPDFGPVKPPLIKLLEEWGPSTRDYFQYFQGGKSMQRWIPQRYVDRYQLSEMHPERHRIFAQCQAMGHYLMPAGILNPSNAGNGSLPVYWRGEHRAWAYGIPHFEYKADKSHFLDCEVIVSDQDESQLELFDSLVDHAPSVGLVTGIYEAGVLVGLQANT